MKTEDLPLLRAIRLGESTDEEDVFIRNKKSRTASNIRVSGRPLLDSLGEISAAGSASILRPTLSLLPVEESNR